MFFLLKMLFVEDDINYSKIINFNLLSIVCKFFCLFFEIPPSFRWKINSRTDPGKRGSIRLKNSSRKSGGT